LFCCDTPWEKVTAQVTPNVGQPDNLETLGVTVSVLYALQITRFIQINRYSFNLERKERKGKKERKKPFPM